MGILRPFVWLALGFVVTPVLYLALGILSIGSPNAGELPAAGIATVCLYLFAADLGWSLFGARPLLGLGAALLALAGLGYGVPALVNGATADKSAAAAAADAAPATVERPAVVALLKPYEQTRDRWQVEPDCEPLCQRLLYRGNRKAVLMGATPAGDDPAAATGLVRYSIERRASCPVTKVPEAGVLSGQMQYGNHYATSEMVEARVAAGDCLIAQPGRIDEADLVAIKSQPDRTRAERAGRDPAVVAAWRSSVFQRAGTGWTRIGQATGRTFSRAKSPLRLRLTGIFPGALDTVEDRSRPDDPMLIEHTLAPWVGWPEGLPGGSAGPPAR